MSILPNWIEALMNQSEDTLVSDQEASEINAVIHSNTYKEVIEWVVISLLEWWQDLEWIWKREIFYISCRADVMQALNSTSSEVAAIMTEKWLSHQVVPAAIVMAYALNEIIVSMWDSKALKYIYTSGQNPRYQIGLRIEWRRMNRSSSYLRIWKAWALHKALQIRRDLLEKRLEIQNETQRNLTREKARQWLVEKWILIPIQQEWEVFKVSHIYRRGKYKSSGDKYIFRVEKDWKRSSKQASISEHLEEPAYNIVIEALCIFFQLSPIERSILKEKQYRSSQLYTS